MWDLWWPLWNWGMFSPSTSVSSANSHSTDSSTLIISSGAAAIGQIMADAPGGISLTATQETN
jgi:hypothetical protein